MERTSTKVKESKSDKIKNDPVEGIIYKYGGREYLHVSNPWWGKLRQWIIDHVKKNHQKNKIRFASCCWTFIRKNRGGEHFDTHTSYLPPDGYPKHFAKDYDLWIWLCYSAGEARLKDNGTMMLIPSFNQIHMDKVEKPFEWEALQKRKNVDG